METKKCVCCKQIKDLKEFSKNITIVDGHAKRCKQCVKNDRKKPKKIKEILPEGKKRCCRCNIIKDKSEFSKSAKDKDGYKPACQVCRNIEAKEYKTKNKEEIKAKGESV